MSPEVIARCVTASPLNWIAVTSSPSLSQILASWPPSMTLHAMQTPDLPTVTLSRATAAPPPSMTARVAPNAVVMIRQRIELPLVAGRAVGRDRTASLRRRFILARRFFGEMLVYDQPRGARPPAAEILAIVAQPAHRGVALR